MNAPELLRRLRAPSGDGLVLRLRTLTPLYTGGIGQLGDQIHPSNLLGGLRQMSCLVARTLGDTNFEAKVWGNAGGGGNDAAAKQVALRWDTGALERKSLPAEISLPRDGDKRSTWWFNTAFTGPLTLTVTRRGISDAHWQILQVALAIQVRHAAFGAKDQFGLGVLTFDGGPFVPPALDVSRAWPKAALDENKGRLNLLRYALGKVRFRPAPGNRNPRLDIPKALTLGLAVRATLRNSLRAAPNALEKEKARLTDLRHRMLGKLNEFGSAVNVSAAYASSDASSKALELRLVVALKPEDKDACTKVFKAFRARVGNAVTLIKDDLYRFDGADWEYGDDHAEDTAAWLNSLAGATP